MIERNIPANNCPKLYVLKYTFSRVVIGIYLKTSKMFRIKLTYSSLSQTNQQISYFKHLAYIILS